ncbi:hypothetical protein F5984_19965 [Rudanella paleaurantiibacter]|uniref:Peptidase M15C domain-containing protein n=1 Tax=Rudanella paleaurantiibacter TaxID=2614655 RepID=A0A7J5TVS2_9BACT|nr:M15 family metallopeptidase [Rudanella paleaurantiibacter]KAB7728033.1 hypothetical protein F5984_19965 [Rudanella paleaurantiibacter]
MDSRSIDDLHPQLAYAFGLSCGRWAALYPGAPTPFLTQTFRSDARQNALFEQPRDGRDNDGDGRIDEADEFVTNARAGQSPHNYRPALALDVGFRRLDGSLDWSEKWFNYFAQLMLELPNITWGGTFKQLRDRPHFELTDWESRVPQPIPATRTTPPRRPAAPPHSPPKPR